MLSKSGANSSAAYMVIFYRIGYTAQRRIVIKLLFIVKISNTIYIFGVAAAASLFAAAATAYAAAQQEYRKYCDGDEDNNHPWSAETGGILNRCDGGVESLTDIDPLCNCAFE